MAASVLRQRGTRCLYTNRIILASAPSSPPPSSTKAAPPTPLQSALKLYRAWLKSDATHYKAAGTGNKFAGKNGLPFPLNPFFKPTPPLADSTREEIYRLHLTEPDTWTVGKLAADYGISFDRVRAILKLKAAEKQAEMAKGIPPQKEFAKGMERLLSAERRGRNSSRREPLRSLLASGLRPFFRMADEDETLSPTDAARILKLAPFSNIKMKIDRASEGKQPVSQDALQQTTIIEENLLHASHKKFAIRDVSQQKAQTLVRETSGILRTQSLVEKLQR
ncbi:hypothetical protein SmJEL517_g03272 [Synchytrium microbalum]|uniref:Uncharacterized protein n=1 Tax=Synchytrium microbalum TaxID=1806994 RepID=A0A507C9A3_9FUNG|nr:uncharacterized protein SmJEL517_g03272 [Synchytrium microbalum]TPX34085.1 hypothetical protein SmJEL517_g03272 [Synchytrium microbalum]